MLSDQETELDAAWFWDEAPLSPTHDGEANPERPLDARERALLLARDPLQLTVVWRGQVLHVTSHPSPRAITLGPQPECDIVVELPTAHVPHPTPHLLLSRYRGEWLLHLPCWLGATYHHNGASLDLRGAASAAPEGLMLNLAPLLPEQGCFHVELGDVELLIQRIHPTPRQLRALAIDAAPLPYMGLSTALHVSLLMLLLSIPVGLERLTDMEHQREVAPRLVRAMVVAPAPEEPPSQQENRNHLIDLQGDGQDDTLAARATGESGRAGAREVMQRHKHRQQLERATARATRRERAAGEDQAMNEVGALALLGPSRALLGGKAAAAHQGASREAMEGALRMGAVGESEGAYGLGLTGAGRGGGASVEEHGVGIALDEAFKGGKLGGQGVAQRARERGEKLDDLFVKYHKDEAQVAQGCLSEEIIRGAIRRRRNQLRACYEHELLKQRDVAGRIELELTISPSGEVVGSRALEDTTGAPQIAACVAARLETLRFPSFTGCESVVARYPFNFHPKQLMVLPP